MANSLEAQPLTLAPNAATTLRVEGFARGLELITLPNAQYAKFVFLTPCCGKRYKSAQLSYRRCSECKEVTRAATSDSLVFDPAKLDETLGPVRSSFLQRRLPAPAAEEGAPAVERWVHSFTEPLEATLVAPALVDALMAIARDWRAFYSKDKNLDQQLSEFSAGTWELY